MAQSPIPPSSWPGAIDTFVDPAASDFETDVHKAEHAKLSAATVGLETALGAQNATFVAALKHSTTPEAYSAVGNTPGHDDAPGIEAAIAAMVAACIADQSYICEVVFDPAKVYYANRAPVANPTINGTAAYSFAQIALPYLSWNYNAGLPLVTLILRSAYDVEGNTDTFVAQPCAIRSTVTTGGGFAAGSGCPSVLGGPAEAGPAPGLPNWSGYMVVIDGVNVIVPDNPPLMGFDFSGINCVDIVKAQLYVPTAGFATTSACSTPQAWGVHFPNNNNGGVQRVGSLRCTGFYSGIRAGEHLAIWRYEAFSNRIALEPLAGIQASWIGYFCDMNNEYGIANNGGSSGAAPVTMAAAVFPPFQIDMWNTEGSGSPGGTGTQLRIFDTNSQLYITANYHPAVSGGVDFSASGAANCKIKDAVRTVRGVHSPPAVPASGTAFAVLWRDAVYTFSGGTVTDIKVNGTATGLTSGAVYVPSGLPLVVDYTVVPTLSSIIVL